MTSQEALKQRDRLQREREQAQAVRVENAHRARLAREALQPIPRERKSRMQEAARAGKTAETDDLDKREDELGKEVQQANVTSREARQAAQAAQRELTRLHHDEFPAFMQAAEDLTRAAAEKLAKLEWSYRAAHEAIEAARAEWTLIISDREQVRRARSNPGERVGPEFKAAAIGQPPDNPLPVPDTVFNGRAFRPDEVEPAQVEVAA